LVAGVLGILIGAALMTLWSGRLVRDYILANPEILPEAMARLREREMSQVVTANRAALETPFASAWAGAKDGDVVLVEFFDYACTYCRKSNPDVERLLREDRRLKVVWREWPVLGPDSESAAEISMAAAQAGRFKPFHDRMFALGRPTAAAIAEARRTIGITDAHVARLRGSRAAETELRRNYELAAALGGTGTPLFVVGGKVLHGAVGYEALKAAIAEARARG
jgi:protein-disulfide isomerase